MAREIVCEIMVRLDPVEFGTLELVQGQHPGKGRAETLRIILAAAALPQDTLLRYRLPPGHKAHRLFPDWRTWGPFSPVDALHRGQKLLREGYEVETVQVEPRVPRASWPDEGEE